MATKIFRPMLNSGQVYARLAGSASALAEVGGVAELKLVINEDIKKQGDYAHTGGGTRAQVNRIKDVMLEAKFQDLNLVNLARAVFGSSAEVLSGTVVAEAVVGYKGGLIKLANPTPTSVVVKKAAATIAMAGNYEVRPEGIFVYSNAVDILDADALTVDYAYAGYDVVQALVASAPELEFLFGGLNEADNGKAVKVEIFKVKMGATSGFNLITTDFAELDVKGEVLSDQTKVGAGISKFFKVSMS
jgi:hypothetical protein